MRLGDGGRSARSAVALASVFAGGFAGAFAGVFAGAGCGSNHSVSPFAVDPTLYLAPRADLSGQLARAERETAGSGLHETQRVAGRLASGHDFLAIGYEGPGRATATLHATRVVTPFGVVLAEGPEEDASRPVELLPFVLEKAYPSGKDLTGDGVVDVVLRAADGRLAVFRVDGTSAAAYPVRIACPPRIGRDENGDGLFDLVAVADVLPGDPIAPALIDVAINDGTAFRDDHPDARAFHERLRRPAADEHASAESQLARALENAFHTGLGGGEQAVALGPALALAARLAPLTPETSVAWVRWRGFVADVLSRPRSLRDGTR